MDRNAWRLGRIADVEIRVDPSWTVIALLVAYSLFAQFTLTYRALSDGAAIALAVAATTLFFGSVLTHELTHALAARRVGIPVRDITLFIFGGATRADVDSHGPKDEFLISLVGPASSVVLAGLFSVASILGRGVLAHPIEGALGYLGWVNLLLAVFNLLPGFPLDGGRVLRSVVWGITHDIRRATRAATLVGQIIGYALIAVGALLVFGGGFITGVWFAAIGWFLAQSARSSYLDLVVRDSVRTVDVDAVMEHGVVTVPANATLQDMDEDRRFRRNQSIFPVEERGVTVGFVTNRIIDGVPRSRWAQTAVRDVMLPLDDVLLVSPSTPMRTALERLQEGTRPFLLVLEGGHAVGILTTPDVARWLHGRRSLAA